MSWIKSSLLFVFLIAAHYQPIMAEEAQIVQISASLLSHIDDLSSEIDQALGLSQNDEEAIHFDDADVLKLWDKLAAAESPDFLNKAYSAYYQAKNSLAVDDLEKAKQLLNYSSTWLEKIWTEDSQNDFSPQHFFATYNNFDDNPFTSPEAKDQMRPFLLPSQHPSKAALDSIFLSSRATLDEASFEKSGFRTKFKQPRSFIRVASHPLLPGYLVKVYLDSELRLKKGEPGWLWFVRRCIGAKQIRKVIDKKKIRYFSVPQKWIYPLPIDPSPPNDPAYLRKPAILLVQDMQLVPKNENYEAWKTKITRKHLNELYTIISHASGSSYRPGNIPYTKNGKFAFIDTEYPERKNPDFKSIRPHLSSEMRAYWDKLVKNGGPG